MIYIHKFRLWKINYTSSGEFSLTLIKDKTPHIKSINDIIFMNDNKLLATVSSDGSCKIFEMPSLNQLKKLTFRLDLNEKQNYSMRGLRYDEKNKILYTIQSPKRGGTFLTKWDAGKNFEPVSTILVSDTICTSIDYSEKYNLIGLGDCKGSLIYVDVSNQMDVVKEVFLSEITIKSVVFKNGNLISGTAENVLKLNYIYKKNLVSFSRIIKVLLSFIFLIHFFNRMKKTHNLNIEL
jgi:WD40 repeat protein